MTRREVLERYKKGVLYHTREATLSATQDEVMQDEALSALTQIEESERLSVEMIERIVKINLPIGKVWARDVAQAIFEAQNKKRGKR